MGSTDWRHCKAVLKEELHKKTVGVWLGVLVCVRVDGCMTLCVRTLVCCYVCVCTYVCKRVGGLCVRERVSVRTPMCARERGECV